MRKKKENIKIIKGKKYATLGGLKEIFGLSDSAIKKRIKGIPSIVVGKLRDRDVKVYLVEAVKKKCADLLTDIPVAGNDGTVEIKGKKFAPLMVCADIIGTNPQTLKKYITSLVPIKIKNRNGRIVDAYDIEEVKETFEREFINKKKK